MHDGKAAKFGGLLVSGAGVLDLRRRAAYIAGHDDVVFSTEIPPPPCPHGTGALSRVKNVPVPPDFGRGTFFQITSALLAFVR